jgi:uncharacterized protein
VVALVISANREAHAFTPPPLSGAVVDTASALSTSDKKALESELAAYRARTTNEVVVFLLPSLHGESMEDVAYGAFNTWKIGRRGKDNGVLLVIAFADHKLRIETGKGVEGRLTDLQSSDIDRERIGPLLRQRRTYDAIVAGVDAIEAALDGRPAPPLPSAIAALPNGIADTASSTQPELGHLEGGPYWYRWGPGDDERLHRWNAKASADRAHWDRLAIVIALSKSNFARAEASIRKQRGDGPIVILLGYLDTAVEVHEGKGPLWGDVGAASRHAVRIGARLQHRVLTETRIEDDLAEELGDIAVADLDRAVPPPPHENSDDAFPYGLMGIFAFVIGLVVFAAFSRRRRRNGPSDGDGGGDGDGSWSTSSGASSASFDTSSSSTFDSSSSPSDTTYTGGGGSSGGGGSTDSW